MKTIIWKGIFYNSLEYFQLFKIEETIIAKSRIIGTFQNNFYFIEYNLKIDKNWKIFNFELELEVNNDTKKISGIKDNKEWKINGDIDPRFRGFDFIDISLSPFTNTLPINSLQLNIGEEKEINVIYIDILEDYVKPVRQKYRKNEETNFRYENIPNDFQADIEIDDQGLVIFYPSLFERVNEN
ncbi:putative glycolipid-binding domain-containing protein [Algoriphagus sp.]|uniref:putative glycolipid-binding domain-containing protein n=1 Tax=Algoriphagus sp. TaxID=1872435 RepID=UPI003F6F4362